MKIDALVVIAGGDCNNAIVNGEKLELVGIRTLYLMYPFDGSKRLMRMQIEKLLNFLSGIKDRSVFKKISKLKKQAMRLDELRVRGRAAAKDVFQIEISSSDLMGDLKRYEEALNSVVEQKLNYKYRIALLGTPPIYPDFHDYLQSIGLHVVYDEMPYEFIRLEGKNLEEIAANYRNYTFARNIKFRLKFIENEIRRREVQGIIHFQQFACHHKLEDPILRQYFNKELGIPYITIEADLPGKTPEQVKLRLDAFAERLGGRL
ncbi:2-hydroxyacyl-CoA dehydratase [Candidatus Bathyarchaeota archaeon]|nr:2-hydroxyacyl-CoA dehydratase [Candidatus Bathyarchaeota archaeon]